MKRVLAVTVLASLFVSAPTLAANALLPCENRDNAEIAWAAHLSRTMVMTMLSRMAEKGVSREQVASDAGRATHWAPMKAALLATNKKLYSEDAEYVQGLGEFLNGSAHMDGGETLVYGHDGTAFCNVYFKETDTGNRFPITYSVDIERRVDLADLDRVLAYAEKVARLPM